MRTAGADRLAFLIDGNAYFSALADTLERARRSVFILGWDIHSGVRLRRDAPDERGVLSLLLDRIVGRRPQLHVRILVWDWNVLGRLGRETVPRVRLGWLSHERVRYAEDDGHPLGACHHEKLVVIDDAVAFVGGIDLTLHRWDTRAHAPGDPRRRDPESRNYPPFHDVQIGVSGPVAASLARHARERWHRATGERVKPVRAAGDPWPPGLRPDLGDVPVGIAHTAAAHDGRPAVRQIESLYRQAIADAERYIYIESQYLTSKSVADALETSLSRTQGPELAIVTPRRLDGWLEETTMGYLRERIVERLRKADRHGRLAIWCPGATFVHSKLCITDDTFLTIGSANLSNRSMAVDTECNLCLRADDARARAAIGGLRDRLLADHLGVEPDAIAAAAGPDRSPLRAVASLEGAPKALASLESEPGAWPATLPGVDLADPERPLAWSRLLVRLFGGSSCSVSLW